MKSRFGSSELNFDCHQEVPTDRGNCLWTDMMSCCWVYFPPFSLWSKFLFHLLAFSRFRFILVQMLPWLSQLYHWLHWSCVPACFTSCFRLKICFCVRLVLDSSLLVFHTWFILSRLSRFPCQSDCSSVFLPHSFWFLFKSLFGSLLCYFLSRDPVTFWYSFPFCFFSALAAFLVILIQVFCYYTCYRVSTSPRMTHTINQLNQAGNAGGATIQHPRWWTVESDSRSTTAVSFTAKTCWSTVLLAVLQVSRLLWFWFLDAPAWAAG